MGAAVAMIMAVVQGGHWPAVAAAQNRLSRPVDWRERLNNHVQRHTAKLECYATTRPRCGHCYRPRHSRRAPHRISLPGDNGSRRRPPLGHAGLVARRVFSIERLRHCGRGGGQFIRNAMVQFLAAIWSNRWLVCAGLERFPVARDPEGDGGNSRSGCADLGARWRPRGLRPCNSRAISGGNGGSMLGL
jgi:hypothetical protein